MHGGAAGVLTWQRLGPLTSDVVGAAVLQIWARQ